MRRMARGQQLGNWSERGKGVHKDVNDFPVSESTTLPVTPRGEIKSMYNIRNLLLTNPHLRKNHVIVFSRELINLPGNA